MKSFYPVDSSSHYFKFNVTPCSMLNKSVWYAAVTWIPSESLLPRELYCLNAKKNIVKVMQAKNCHFTLNVSVFKRYVSVINNGIDKLQRWSEIMISKQFVKIGVFEFGLCRFRSSVHWLALRVPVWGSSGTSRKSKQTFAVYKLFWSKNDPRYFKGKKYPSMSGLWICIL